MSAVLWNPPRTLTYFELRVDTLLEERRQIGTLHRPRSQAMRMGVRSRRQSASRTPNRPKSSAKRTMSRAKRHKRGRTERRKRSTGSRSVVTHKSFRHRIALHPHSHLSIESVARPEQPFSASGDLDLQRDPSPTLTAPRLCRALGEQYGALAHPSGHSSARNLSIGR